MFTYQTAGAMQLIQMTSINAFMIVKVDTDDEYEFAGDMQVIILFCLQSIHLQILGKDP
jgi:hypothetical protein